MQVRESSVGTGAGPPPPAAFWGDGQAVGGAGLAEASGIRVWTAGGLWVPGAHGRDLGLKRENRDGQCGGEVLGQV